MFTDMETERLILKSISRDDREFILKHFSDSDVNRYLYDAEPFTSLKEADELIDFYIKPEPRQQHRWIIILKDNSEKVGTCGYHRWDRAKHSAEIGYDMQKAYWGQGIMSEALGAVLPFAFNIMGVQNIDAHIYTGNINSLKLARRSGFTFTGKVVRYLFRGEEYTHHIYSLSAK